MDKWSKNAAESPKLIEFSIYISIKLNQNFSKFDDSTFTVYAVDAAIHGNVQFAHRNYLFKFNLLIEYIL